MIHVILLVMTNLSVMVLFGSVLSLLGCWSDTTFTLMKMACVFGLGGALISLLLSKFIALSTVNGVIVRKASNDLENWLLNVIYNQSQKLGIDSPQLAIYNATDMNAFATGSGKNMALIAVSTGLLQNMNQESIEAVIAHEMSHIVSGDMISMTLMQGIINTFIIFISRGIAKFVSGCTACIGDQSDTQEQNGHYDARNVDDSSSIVYIVVSAILEMLFGIFASIIVFWFSRNREFYADAGAARLVGSRNMISALQALKFSHESNNNISNNISTLYINNQGVKNIFSSDIFASHPSLDRRIEALRRGIYFNKSSYFFRGKRF